MGINHGGNESARPTAWAQGYNPPPKSPYRQDPIAVVGFANRLPGQSDNPTKLWQMLERGGIAGNDPPPSRWNLKGHFDGSRKPHTVRTPGAMFMENVDPADFDAGFFNTSGADAISLDPQQRQLLEVVYEGLENAGISLERIDGAAFGCFVGSYAVDYHDIQVRDPEDRVDGMTIGVGRAILSNRISHFLNIKGASMTIDTACSGSLVCVDVACRYLQTGQIDGAIIAASNIYMCPDHNQDMGAMRSASSISGKCHTFDAKADGYCKGEGVNTLILKRLDDALRDGDPIRAIIRGTATNSDGWTPGIASPNAHAQTVAMRAAFAAASLVDLNQIGYLECHGTGTQAGDPIEVSAASTVFAPSRSAANPLIIGSIKSNIGHSENAAGISGMLKAVMAVEKGIIPGNPTFIDPNPKIDFETLKVKATRTAIPWPQTDTRTASVNSFGYGGSNAHAVIQDAQSFLGYPGTPIVSSIIGPDVDLFGDDDDEILDGMPLRPQLLAFSGNDEYAVKGYTKELRKHLANPTVKVNLIDLAYTLSERRSRLFNRGYLVTKTTDLDEAGFVYGKKSASVPKIALVFTGQGAQWSQMGKSIVDTFPQAKLTLQRLDNALQKLPAPPSWSLSDELVSPRVPEHLRLPEYSQPLVTALQLVMLDIFTSWGVSAQSVVGHSSGEIAAACAAGYLTEEDAITIAFYRGQAAKELQSESEGGLGMMAVGLGPDQATTYIQELSPSVQIACYNSPSSVTLSGKVEDLETVKARLQNDGHFARMLQVNLAYHSKYMSKIGERYETLLTQNCGSALNGQSGTRMISSVTGSAMNIPADAAYWKTNMVSAVRFNQACTEMISGKDGADFLIELGPSGALAGPVSQIKKAVGDEGSKVQYFPAAKRGPDSASSMFDVAGRLFISGGSIDLAKVNQSEPSARQPAMIIDLPNYVWNHQTKYWYESEASREWRYRTFIHHDILGSKVLNSPWTAPLFKKMLDVKDVPWLMDHKMGAEIVFPAAGFCSMAMEALYQCVQSTRPVEGVERPDQLRYRLRNVKFEKALVLEVNKPVNVLLALVPHPGTKDSWYDFRVSSKRDDMWSSHCHGLVRIEDHPIEMASADDIAPLKNTTKGSLWYKALTDVGYGFGPAFTKHLEAESIVGERRSRSLFSLTEPTSKWDPQSVYPMHPACLDGAFQTVIPSVVAGSRSAIDGVLLPAVIDDLVVNPMKTRPAVGLSVTRSDYVGKGRLEESKNYKSGCSVYDPDTGAMLMKLTGLHCIKLETKDHPAAAHTFTRASWKPDVTFLTQKQLPILGSDRSSTEISKLLDLIAHKNPTLNVMEINLTAGDSTSLWYQEGRDPRRDGCRQYLLACCDATTLVAAQRNYESESAAKFALLDMAKPDTAPKDTTFDLVIVKRAAFSADTLAVIAKNARSVLGTSGHVMFLEQGYQTHEPQINGNGVVNGGSSLDHVSLQSIMETNNLSDPMKISCDSVQSASLAQAKDNEVSENPSKSVHLIRLIENDDTNCGTKTALENLGWTVTEGYGTSGTTLPPKVPVLILDEMTKPVLSTISDQQWETVKNIVSRAAKLLWVTCGSQFEVSKPENALVHGFFRTIRAEDVSLSLTTLDVESAEGPATASAIGRVLESLNRPMSKTRIESEYVERRGIIHVNRISSDQEVNQFKVDEVKGAEFQTRSLHEMPTMARLRAERVGTLDSLQFGEVAPMELPVQDGCIEVEIYAAGLNFKDVAVTMGIVPENEHLLGLEGAGVVRRVGHGVTTYKPGDSAVVFEKGCFANRIQVTKERSHILPEGTSFEDAATLTGVYLTSLYCLFHLGNLQKGQSVLIHSAAGGVGISSIQLAQHKGAEIYVTVGSDSKRDFLHSNFGIPYERMFSSRTTEFASKIRAATNGRGIDVILNSLTGELLDESWRLCADNGVMVEIGKKDVLDRNYLSMEPFDRNCSFRALDFSHKTISDSLIASLLSEIFDLYEGRHIKPIHPIEVFPFEDIPAAFAFMRSGRHIGKVVISSGPDAKVEVPVRPAPRNLKLRDDVAYLIVGGLRGLCGSLAIHLAQHGAKHIISMSRSGCSDDNSQGIARNCRSIGCEIYEAKADVSRWEDVLRTFKEAPKPIGGIIQGAMVLRDKPYETMTVDEFHTTISNKVQGTWNVHNAAIELQLNLDFFTMLSSISGVVGQKGQANYAAANAFMDAFATYRQSLGYAANSVDLGVIEDVGYVAEQGGMQQHFDKLQWTGINEFILRKIVSYSIWQQGPTPINQASSAQLITGIAVPLPDDADIARDARFAGLFASDETSSGGNSGNDANQDIQAFFLLHNAGAASSALVTPCVEIVSQRFTKMLRLSEPMEPGKSLSSYGLDSLSAVEFRNWVRAELQVELSTLEITTANSLIVLCERIISKLATPISAPAS